AEEQSDRARSPVLAGRQPVPLYRLRQDHPRRARCRGRDARGFCMSEREFTYVGTRPVRHDGVDKVTGRANYGADFTLPGMLHGAVLRSPHAHARIVSIDTSAAESTPGVKAVVTSKDFVETTAKLMMGEGALDIHDIGDNVIARKKALYDGHAVAAVAATTEEIAREAAAKIRVTYEILEPVLSIDRAVAQD